MSDFVRLARLCPLLVVVAVPAVHANPVVRTSVVQRGGFVLVGNTLGHDCRPGVPTPIVGTVGSCGMNTHDSAPDVLWVADSPTANAAEASVVVLSSARSTAVLLLPSGATVTHAYLYWAGTGGGTAASDALLERPGASGFSATVTAATVFNGISEYQSVADVTNLVRMHGAGPYRVGRVLTSAIAFLPHETFFAGWALVVLYSRPTDPLVALTVADGLDLVVNGAPSSVTISGFRVPSTPGSASLGVLAFEGDDGRTGEALKVNGTVLSNASNPVGNIFNSTRSTNGMATTAAGDLPQLTGTGGSLSGVDLDVFDLSPQLVPGATSLQVEASTVDDEFFLGAVVTAVPTVAPHLMVAKSATDVNGGGLLRGDVLRYSLTITNTGDDSAVGTVLSDALPAEVSFVPGSLQVGSGPNSGMKTDSPSDDQAEYVSATRSVVFRLGAGASATDGGTLATMAATTVSFDVTVNAGASGVISNSAQVVAAGLLGAPAVTFTSSPPTVSSIVDCLTDSHCSSGAPRCLLDAGAPRCVACLSNTDCSGGTPTCTASNVCGACVASGPPSCAAATPVCNVDAGALSGACTECSVTEMARCMGSRPVCLASSGRCGCARDVDCGGPTSGVVCDAMSAACVAGCRGSGGNGCAAGFSCGSTTTAIGPCVATPVDSGVADAGGVDAGGVDSGVADAGRADAGANDAGRADAGFADAAIGDAGLVDAGLADAGFPDAGPEDAGGAGGSGGGAGAGAGGADVMGGAGGSGGTPTPSGCGCTSSSASVAFFAMLAMLGRGRRRASRP